MKPHLSRRVAALQAEMAKSFLDAIVFADRENLIYYAGTTDIECMAMVIPATGQPIMCCLWLDIHYVRDQTESENILSYRFPTSNIAQLIVKAMQNLGLQAPRVGFHKYFVEFAVFDAIRHAFPGIEFCPAMELTYRVRAVKDTDELLRIQRACNFVVTGMEAAVRAVTPGVTEVAVLAEADYAMRKAGSEGATFRMQVLTRPKQLLAHPYAGDVVIKNNQPIVIHLGATCQGYAAKICRTVALGAIPDETRRIHDVLETAQEIAVEAATPGTQSADIYDAVRTYVDGEGYGSQLIDHLGYGVGIRQSEFYPVIGKGVCHEIAENMVVDLLLSTIHKPGVGGPRLTDMIRIGTSGGEYMTRFPREIINK